MMRNERGITLLELLVGLGLGGILTAMVIWGFNLRSHTSAALGQKSDVNTEMVLANRFIQRIGRAASLCRKPAAVQSLECQIDFTRPASGAMRWVRFLMVNNGTSNALEYQWDSNNDGAFTATRMITRYSQIAALTVCDNAAMNPATTPGTCDLEPIALSTLFHQYANGTVAPPMGGNGRTSRYFRYRISSAAVAAGISPDGPRVQVAQQGAFYRRNPTPFGVPFQW